MTNVPEHIFDLIMQDFAEGLPPEKAIVLKEWLEESAENRIAWTELFDTWRAGAIGGFPANKTNEAWSKISNRANTSKTRTLNWKAIYASVAVAASIAIIVSLWFVMGGRNNSDAQWAKLNEMATIPSSVKLVLNSGEEVLLQDTVDHELPWIMSWNWTENGYTTKKERCRMSILLSKPILPFLFTTSWWCRGEATMC